jgi:hypothetical protein
MNWVTLSAVVMTFLTAVIGLVAGLGNRRKIAEVHVLVNSQLTDKIERVAQLTITLEKAGVDVPPEEPSTSSSGLCFAHDRCRRRAARFAWCRPAGR